jgi:hypothetical protein
VKSAITNLLSFGLWWSLFYLASSLMQRESAGTGLALILGTLAAAWVSAAVTNLKYVRCRKLWRFLWVVPLLELARLPLVLHSYLTNEIAWRGRRYRVEGDGTLRRVGA